MADNILFTGDFGNSDIIQGIDEMTNAFKRLQDEEKRLQTSLAQGQARLTQQNAQLATMTANLAANTKGSTDYEAVNNRLSRAIENLTKQNDALNQKLAIQRQELETATQTADRMGTAYDKAKESIEDLQKTSGKPISPTINDGDINRKIADIQSGVEGMTNTVNVKVAEARKRLSDLIATQAKYKDDIKELNGALRANESEFKAINNQLIKLQKEGKGSSKEAQALKDQIRGLSTNTNQLKNELGQAQVGLAGATAQIRTQTVAVRQAETAQSNFAGATRRAYGGLRTLANIIPGLGIASLVGLIAGPLVAAFRSWADTMDAAERTAQRMNAAINGSGGAFQKAYTEVALLRAEINLAKDGFTDKDTVVKNFNETIGKTVGQVNSLEEAEKSLNDNAENYIKMTLYKAAATLALDEAAKVAFESMKKQREAEERIARINARGSSEADKRAGADGLSAFVASGEKNLAAQAKREAEAAQKDLTDIAQGFLEDAAKAAVNFKPLKDPIKATAKKQAREITNIYEQELLKLQSDIAKINEKGFTDESSITATIEADFKKRDAAYVKAFRDKKLTAGQLAALQGNLKELQDLTLKNSLEDFNRAKEEYLSRINSQIEDAQHQANVKRIYLIQDSFERERATITSESDKTIRDLEAKRDKTIADIIKNAAKNGFTEADIKPQLDEIRRSYSGLIDDLELLLNQRLQKLSFDTFLKLDQEAVKVAQRLQSNISQRSLIDLQEQSRLLAAGKISYEQYQKELTRITREEAKERNDIEIARLEQLIRRRENYLATATTSGKLTDDQQNQLLDEISGLKGQLAAARSTSLKSENEESEEDSKYERVMEYANAIKTVTDAVIAFWNDVNEAEQRALDRSITLQNSRVEAARNIAARGNAEYLRMEEEKQQELLIKKENAARRQMAINTAMQASSILVGVAGAVAKIADGPTGPAETIAALGVIFSSLAAGYALVKQMQNNQPSFFVGTEDTGNGGNVDNKGGFHAILHPHERVITAEDNKKLRGLTNKEVIERVHKYNTFTENFRVPQAPALNLAAMDAASIQSAGLRAAEINGLEEQNRKLDENNMLQKGILRALKSMGISVNMDEKGIALSVMNVAEEIVKSKRK